MTDKGNERLDGAIEEMTSALIGGPQQQQAAESSQRAVSSV